MSAAQLVERNLWAQLSVFPAGFDLEAAEAVRSDGDPMLDIMDRLVSKSLLAVDRSADVPRPEVLRYSQLMTVREYGSDLLSDDERFELRRRHRDHYLHRTRNEAAAWCGPTQSELLAQYRTDHADLMAALDWSLQCPSEQFAAAELAAALRYHWIAGGNLSNGRIRLEQLLQRMPASTRERGAVLWVTAWVALIQGDHVDAAAHLDECGAIAIACGDVGLQAHHDHWSALQALFLGHTPESIRLYRRAIEVHRRLGDDAAALTASFQLACGIAVTLSDPSSMPRHLSGGHRRAHVARSAHRPDPT